MSGLAIRFKLRDLRDIVPWGEPGSKSLHWFGITDGCYCVETPIGKLLEYDEPADLDLGVPWCHYPVVRLFEDILQCLPFICDPIPHDIWSYFFSRGMPVSIASSAKADFWNICKSWFDCRMREASDPEVDLLGNIQSAMWGDRDVDFHYLRVSPQLHLWCVDALVHLNWEAKSPWLPSEARLTIAVEELRDAVTEFCRAFLAEMGERVAMIVREGWPGEQCDLNVPGLAREQIQRENDAATALSAKWATDWEQVRGWLAELDGLVQKS